jgi:uncharacterized protein (DUF169 family)
MSVGGLGWRVDIAELSERLEKLSVRYGELLGFERDPDWFLLKLQEEMGELLQAYLQHTGRARTKGRTAETNSSCSPASATSICRKRSSASGSRGRSKQRTAAGGP